MSSTRFVKLDIDSRVIPATVPERITFALDMLALRAEYVRYDRTRRGWHVTVKLSRAISPLRVVALQAICGSDPHREIFNLARVSNLRNVPERWRSQWNVFFTANNNGE
jgi:hypothetical protein